MENNNNKLPILATMPLSVCLPSSQLSSTTLNVLSVASSSITPLRNHRVFKPKLNRLTAVKQLARNRRKTYQKYGPYTCQWCDDIFKTSQFFAAHMRNHYRAEKNPFKAAKQAQEKDEPQLSPEALAKVRRNRALRRAKAQLEKARKQTEELTAMLAQAKAKTKEATKAHAPPSTQPNSCAWTAAAPTPGPILSSSGLRINDVHLRLGQSLLGVPLISVSDINHSLSTHCILNTMDFLYSNRMQRTIQNSSRAYVCQQDHQVQPGFASSSRSRPVPVPVPARAPKDSTNTKLVVVKHQIFPDEDVKPLPGFHHMLTTGPDGRQFIIQKAKLEYYDDDNLDLKL